MTIRKTFYLIVLICIIFLIGLLCHSLFYNHRTLLPTYFTYTKSELEPLLKKSSEKEIVVDDLNRWDSVLFSLIRQNKLGDAYAARVYAYLYTAQRDFVFTSHNLKGKIRGNIDMVTGKVLCEFFPNNCSSLMSQIVTDDYSHSLADIVLEKVKERMISDSKTTKLYSAKSPDHYWAGSVPYFGQDAGSWKTWLIGDVKNYVAPLPPAYDSPEWHKQLDMTTTALKNISPEQTKTVVFWAGNPGTVTPPGQWLIFANAYMNDSKTPLLKMILIRSVLAMGIADSAIAVFNSKYTYWVKRPFMLDPTIVTIMPTPNHPSYPAGHSTISSAAATILQYYFPENSKYWEKEAQEASHGRVWGGIHFTIDAEQGFILGHKLGEAAIAAQAKPVP